MAERLFWVRGLRWLLIAALALAAPLARADEEFEWQGVERIVAIGDVHGAYDNLVRVLQSAQLIDDKLRWIGGATHLVQNGDMVDRGPESRKAMDLLMKLEEKAEDAGGRVHVLIGNHEAMNIVGLLDLVADEEYEAFMDRDSRERHEKAFERYYDDLRREAREQGEKGPKKSDVWADFSERYPLGFIEHRRAFAPTGRYGEWITNHNTSIKINDILFSHGDWSEKFSEIGLKEVNESIRRELKGEIPIESGLTFDEASPLQYRGLANTPLSQAAQAAEAPRVTQILDNVGASRMVVGHTTTPGRIETRFEGKHVSIDVGMLEIYNGGHRIALEIVGDSIRAIHDGGTVPLPAQLDETNEAEYIEAVAAVDPDNLDVQIRLVDQMRARGEEAAAVPVLERLFDVREDFVPFRYHDFLGRHYEALGDEAKAEDHYEAYLEGLSQLVAENPENLNLANLMARFSVDKKLRLEDAESAIRGALEQASDNFGFRVTLARVLIARGDATEALTVLESFAPPPGFAYEAYYYAGIAHLELNQPEQARASFQKAVAVEPDREEAKQELVKLGGVAP